MTEQETSHKSFVQPGEAIERLVKIMSILRSPEGCPWDAEQTPESLKTYIIEEAYETLDAIDLNIPDAIRDELGDLLLQIIFQARIFEERKEFSMADVANSISDKLVRRHPHVFAGTPTGDAQMLATQWETIKAGENINQGKHPKDLNNIPRHLPALQKARKLIEKTILEQPPETAKDLITQAFDLFDNLADDVRNIQNRSLERQFGELLFTLTKLGHLLNIDTEQALRKKNNQIIENYNAKFKYNQNED